MRFKPNQKVRVPSHLAPPECRDEGKYVIGNFFGWEKGDVNFVIRFRKGTGHNARHFTQGDYNNNDLWYVDRHCVKPVDDDPFTDEEYKEFFV